MAAKYDFYKTPVSKDSMKRCLLYTSDAADDSGNV